MRVGEVGRTLLQNQVRWQRLMVYVVCLRDVLLLRENMDFIYFETNIYRKCQAKKDDGSSNYGLLLIEESSSVCRSLYVRLVQ